MDRRSFLVAGLAAGAAIPGLSCAQQVRRIMMHGMTPARVTGAPAQVALTPWRTMPGVQVMVNGAGPFTFGIDTGFPGMATFRSEIAQAAGLTVSGQDSASDPSGRNPITIDRYHLPRLAIGPMLFEGIEASAMPPLPVREGEAPLQGILGMGLFLSHTLTFDFPGAKIAVTGEALPAADERTVFQYQRGQLVELPLRVGERQMRCHLDTGQSRMPLIVPQEAIAGLATHGEARSIGVAHTVSQAIPMFAIGLDAPVRMGEVRFPVTEIGYPAPIAMANLGSAALQAMVVKLDGRVGRVQFIAPASAA